MERTIRTQICDYCGMPIDGLHPCPCARSEPVPGLFNPEAVFRLKIYTNQEAEQVYEQLLTDKQAITDTVDWQSVSILRFNGFIYKEFQRLLQEQPSRQLLLLLFTLDPQLRPHPKPDTDTLLEQLQRYLPPMFLASKREQIQEIWESLQLETPPLNGLVLSTDLAGFEQTYPELQTAVVLGLLTSLLVGIAAKLHPETLRIIGLSLQIALLARCMAESRELAKSEEASTEPSVEALPPHLWN